jgi:hypothetical protein
MQTEPPKADPPRRKRRRFQFSLRTLLIFVMLLAVTCGYVCRQVEIVAARKAWLESHPWDLANPDEIGPGRLMPLPVRYAGDKDQEPSLIRRWLGDVSADEVEVSTAEDEATARSLFPEAQIIGVAKSVPRSE